MNATPPTVFCVTSARLLKDLAPALQAVARVRWVPDEAAMMRMFMVHSPVGACIVEQRPDTLATLDAIRRRSPATRRLLVADACDLRMVREMLETGAVDEFLYQPFDPSTMGRSIGVAERSRPTARPDADRSAASHA